MSKQAILSQITAELSRLGVSFQAGNGADLTIVNDFVDAAWSTGIKRISYEASVFLDEQTSTAFMWEKTKESGGGFSGGFSGESSFQSGATLYRKVVSIQYGPDGRAVEYKLDLGAITKSVKNAAKQYGWKFKTVLVKAKAQFPAGYQPQAPAAYPLPQAPIAYQQQPQAPAAFCGNCGKPLLPGARFCDNCGQLQGSAAPAGYPPQSPVPPPAYTPQVQYPGQPAPYAANTAAPKSKTPLIIGIAIAVLVVVLVIFGVSQLLNNTGDPAETTETTRATTARVTTKTTKETTAPTTTATAAPTTTAPAALKLVLSQGISPDDLGNSGSGQFVFDTGEYIFYPDYDTANSAHIYRYEAATDAVTTIFDGFGWSLVADGGWLYFAGNPGAAIDGTYNLYRIKYDGSGLQQLNTYYNYGLNIYGGFLYFVRNNPSDETKMLLCRSALDGTGEEILFQDFPSSYAIYNDAIYYISANSFICRANPDGTGSVTLINSKVMSFIIGSGQLVYLDDSDNILVADSDGQNSKMMLIRAAGSDPVDTINSYGASIYYTTYNKTWIETSKAYDYQLHRIAFDGSDDQLIYSSQSDGSYVNIINDTVIVLDYAADQATGTKPAILRRMDLDGANLADLPR